MYLYIFIGNTMTIINSVLLRYNCLYITSIKKALYFDKMYFTQVYGLCRNVNILFTIFIVI